MLGHRYTGVESMLLFIFVPKTSVNVPGALESRKNGEVGKTAKNGLSCVSLPGELGYFVASLTHTGDCWSGNQSYLVNEVSSATAT